jgi:hypothetical protein
MTPGHVHTRSHSFTPKLPSRLANLGGASPGKKGSTGEVEPAVEMKEGKEKRGVAFPFHFGGSTSSLFACAVEIDADFHMHRYSSDEGAAPDPTRGWIATSPSAHHP